MKRREFFDRHARHWDEAKLQDMSLRLTRVAAEANLRCGHRVLDVGTGTGVLIPHILQAVGQARRIVALDISAEMLAVARTKGFPPNVYLVQADVHAMPLAGNSFERVICNAALPHFVDRQEALAEMMRVLCPAGLLVISHPIGREAVNALHRDAEGAVAEDRVPHAGEMRRLLEHAGFVEIRVVDEPEFYLAAGRKPSVPPRGKRCGG